jgi:hypothetical protein
MTPTLVTLEQMRYQVNTLAKPGKHLSASVDRSELFRCSIHIWSSLAIEMIEISASQMPVITAGKWQ